MSTALPTPPTVLALDLSLTATGVADIDGTPYTIASKEKGAARLHDIRTQVTRYLDGGGTTWRAGLVAIEGYAFGRANQAHQMGELGGVIRHLLWMLTVPMVEVSPSQVKQYACGKGSAKKDDVFAAAIRRLGYEGNSKDEADALWLRALVLDALGHPVVTVPAQHRKALAKVVLPAVAPS